MKNTKGKRKEIKYRAVKVKTRPVKIEFYTKKGEKLAFKGRESYEVSDPLELKTPDLIRWLRKNKLPNLAKAIQKATKLALNPTPKK